MNSLDPLEIESVLNLQTKLPPLIPTNKSKLTEGCINFLTLFYL